TMPGPVPDETASYPGIAIPSSDWSANSTIRDATNMPANTAEPIAAPLPMAALVMRHVSTSEVTNRSRETSVAASVAEGRNSLSNAGGKSSQAMMAEAQLLATT